MIDRARAVNYARARELAHGRLLESLAEKVRPEHTAVLVVDVLNDFCAEGGLADREGLDLTAGQAMGARVPRLLDAARDAGALVVFVRSEYSTGSNAYLSDAWLDRAARLNRGGSYTTAPVCAPGSPQADYYGDVRPRDGDVVVVKHRYAAFHATDLDLVLRTNGIRTVVIAGIVTNVCVETAAREAFVRDYYVVVLDDGCAAYVQADHEQTLSNVRRFFGDVSTIDDVIAAWGGLAPQRSGA